MALPRQTGHEIFHRDRDRTCRLESAGNPFGAEVLPM
jgi:hypothetical protein